MKKTVSIILAALMILSVLAFAGCDKGDAASLKFGMGVYAYYDEATSADGETNGSGTVCITVAAVLVDENGKIVKVDFDSTENSASYTSEGKAVAAGEFLTKKEKGDNYGMVAWGGATLEWYAQVDALETALAGKTLDEAKAVVVDGYKGNDEILNAGCTIAISDFIFALEKAMANVADSSATADTTLNIGMVTVSDEAIDASEEANGSHVLATSITASALDKDGKVIVCSSDAVDAEFVFGTAGEAIESTAALQTKKEKGANYNMANYGQDLNGDGVVKEWFEQAAAFDAACAGLTANEIAALAVNGYGVESLQAAGCTISVSNMVNAAVKSATIG